MIKKLKQTSGSWYFLIVVIMSYVLLWAINPGLFSESLHFFYKIIIKIIPIFLLVFALMTLTNYFITPQFVMKHLKVKGVKKWFYVIVGGILSTGPIYMWYPLLAEFKSKGLGDGLVACFLYNRAIKVPLLPFAIYYFGWSFVIVLTAVMIFVSVIQGIIIDKLMEE